MDISTRPGMLLAAQCCKVLSDLDWAGQLSAERLGAALGRPVLWGGKSDSLLPARGAFWDGSQLVVLLAGVRTPAQAAYVYAGSTAPRAFVSGASVNPAIAPVAAQVVRELSAAVGQGWEDLLVIGHSYGGMIGQTIGALVNSISPLSKTHVFTMGSPRTGDGSLGASLAGVECVRLMCDNDPVPFFPPHWDEAPLGVTASGWPTALYWSEYAQGPGGYVLRADGSVRGAELPDQIGPIADLNLLLWLQAATARGHPGHNLATYVQRLGAGTPQMGPPVPAVSASLKGELAVPLPQELFNQGLPQGLNLFVEYLSMASESVYLPPAYLPEPKKIQTTTGVYWFGVQFIQTDTFSNARTISKYMRRWLRYQQRAAEFDAGTFNSAFSEYLAVASSPQSGFQPVLTVKY